MIDQPGAGASPDHAAKRRWSLLDRLLVGLIGTWLAIGYAVRALAPSALDRAPRLLVFLDPEIPTMLLELDRLGTLRVASIAALGMVVMDPVAFHLGRRHGDATTAALARYLPTSFRAVRWAEALLRQSKGSPVALFSGVIPCALAGAARVSWPAFLFFDLTGIVLRIGAALAVYHLANDQVGTIGRTATDWAIPLTVVTVLWVVVDLELGRRQRRRREVADRIARGASVYSSMSADDEAGLH